MRRLIAGAIALAVLGVPAAADAKGRYRAEIQRTTGGVAHIRAKNYGSLGYGYGYAYAQDQICELSDIVTTVRAQRSQLIADTPDNRASDFFYQRIKDEKIVPKLLKRSYPEGPAKFVRQTVTGMAAGVNAELARHKVTDPTCKGKAYVRKITPMDLWLRFYQLGLRASSGNFLHEIVNAAPPGAATAASHRLPAAGTVRRQLRHDPVLGDQHDQLGSNGVAVGSKGVRSGKSVLLGNPHFPWQGSDRWYEVHMTIPGKLDVTGAALQLAPVVNIGFNHHVAWTHTVSTARRFTPYELKLVAGQPDAVLRRRQGPRHGQADGHDPRGRRPDRVAHLLRDDLGAGAVLPGGAAHLGHPERLRARRRQRGRVPAHQPVARLRPRALGERTSARPTRASRATPGRTRSRSTTRATRTTPTSRSRRTSTPS